MEALIILVNAVVILGLIFWLFSKTAQFALHSIFMPAVFLKIIAGISLGLIYQFHYGGGDTFTLYHDAEHLGSMLFSNPGGYFGYLFSSESSLLSQPLVYSDQPRALFLVKILSFIHGLTGANYWIMAAYLSLISFIGLWFVTEEMIRFYGINPLVSAIAFLLYPSVVFWSSGLIKESISTTLICLLVFLFHRFFFRLKFGLLPLVSSGILAWLLYSLKYYYAAILLPILITAFLVEFLKLNSPRIQSSGSKQIKYWALIFIVMIGMASTVHPNLNLDNILTAIVSNHDLTLAASENSGVIHYSDLKPEAGSIILNFPLALFSGLFRPWVGDASSIFSILTGIENFFLLILFGWALFNLRKAKSQGQLNLVFTGVMYVALTASLLALSSPNFGSLTRYKVGFLPFFILLILSNNPLVPRYAGRLKALLKLFEEVEIKEEKIDKNPGS